MLTTLPDEGFLRLRAFFEESGYTETNLRKHLGAPELPSRQLRNHARLLDRTSTPSALNALLRWFWIGVGQDELEVSESIPADIVSLLLDCGAIEANGEVLVPRAMFLHIDGFLIVSDHPVAIDRRQAEMVLWPNPTSKFLSRFAIRRRSRATLDLGTGSGILSLNAAKYSDLVTATDLSQRAVACAKFNASLNSVANIEVLAGDCFEPVAGRRFDLILSNPPFFITPQSNYLFCENSMELDGLCRRLIREAPTYLNEDGYMEMLCEWAQIKGQAWEERIADWLKDIGCDAWVMKGLTQDPEEYAQHRIRETSTDMTHDADQYTGYMNYYRDRGVEAIHDGLIVLRRRTGSNFIRIEEVPKTPIGDLSQLILTTFAAHDLVRANESEEQLLALRPRLASTMRLEQTCVPSDGQWHTESLTLRLTNGFPFHMEVQPLVATFLVSMDGTVSAREAIKAFAIAAEAPLEKVQPECITMIRKLLERGFMVAQDA